MFSVLLPTHDRLELLRNAVDTVRRQDFDDWELIVSDNASAADLAGYVAQLDDPRIRYIRTPAFMPVTASWNHALEATRGDYVIMLGDDDGLLPGYFRALRDVVETHDRPELVYHSALLLAYPGVLPEHPDGYLQDYTGTGLVRNAPDPYPLESADAKGVVRKAMRFEMGLGYNMQFSLVSRRLIERIQTRGAFFQSAFPDYYATLAMLLEARSIVIDPRPRVVVGISPKSYGFFHFNGRDEEGRRFLGGKDPEPRSQELPGSNINAGWLDAMQTLERTYGVQHRLSVKLWRYRFIQSASVYIGHYVSRQVPPADLHELQRHLTRGERIAADLGMAAYGIARRILGLIRAVGIRPPMNRAHELLGRSPEWAGTPVRTSFRNVVEVFDAAQTGGTTDPGGLADVAGKAA